jgi:hypothetical protein
MQGEVVVTNLSQHEIHSAQELGSLLARGALQRATARYYHYYYVTLHCFSTICSSAVSQVPQQHEQIATCCDGGFALLVALVVQHCLTLFAYSGALHCSQVQQRVCQSELMRTIASCAAAAAAAAAVAPPPHYTAHTRTQQHKYEPPQQQVSRYLHPVFRGDAPCN